MFRCLCRVQNNFFNESISARPCHRKKHHLSLDLFRQYEIEISTTCTYQSEMFIFVFRSNEKYILITKIQKFLMSISWCFCYLWGHSVR